MSTTEKARRLRKNMTDAERCLWRWLRLEQIDGRKFRRQTPIGPYIVDFVCFEAMLIIEADGGQHGEDRDRQRTEYLKSLGYKVIRFWNNDILLEIDAVLEVIRREILDSGRPHPTSPVGGGAERGG